MSLDPARVVAELRGNDGHLRSMIRGEDQRREGIADRGEHHFAGADEAATDHDDLGVEHVHEIGDAQRRPPAELTKHGQRGRVAVRCGARDVLTANGFGITTGEFEEATSVS